MAIIGGAGNPVGGSFTGPAEALEVIGKHCYAYAIGPASTNEVNYLSFTSGNFYTVGEITFNGHLEFGNGQGTLDAWKLQMNGVIIGVYKTETTLTTADLVGSVVVPLLIPAYTEIIVSCDSDDTNTDKLGSCSIVGRIYRTRD